MIQHKPSELAITKSNQKHRPNPIFHTRHTHFLLKASLPPTHRPYTTYTYQNKE